MQIIQLNNTETEDVVGFVTTVEKMDFMKFIDLALESFKKFHKSEQFNDGDYTIEDFVDYHNENNDVKIDWVLYDYIQLSEKSLN